MSYTKEEIYRKLDAAKQYMPGFYRQDFVKNRGRTKDTKEQYTEIVAEWLMDHLKLLRTIPTITKTASYKMPGHNGFIDIAHAQNEEDRIAKKMFSQRGLPLLGLVLDYQTPLKDKQVDDAGKIDLLTYDGSILRILELKRPDSKETMLRCVLEAYTYFQTVDAVKLLKDFGLAPETKVKVSPLVFHNGSQHREMKQERPHLKTLMEKLRIEPYYFNKVRKTKDFFLVTK